MTDDAENARLTQELRAVLEARRTGPFVPHDEVWASFLALGRRAREGARLMPTCWDDRPGDLLEAHRARKVSRDPEAAALATCFEALTALDRAARARVLAYLRTRNEDARSWPASDDEPEPEEAAREKEEEA